MSRVLVVSVCRPISSSGRAYSYSIYSGGSRKKYLGGPGPSSFGRQPRLSEITIEPISGVLPKI